jgi:hypothetical protein
MIETGQVRFALIPGTNEQIFVEHMRDNFPQALTPTRTTTHFHHLLMKGPVPGQYVWQTTVDLMTESGYEFLRNASKIQEIIENKAVLIGVDVFKNLP